jgi:hypothetical protein
MATPVNPTASPLVSGSFETHTLPDEQREAYRALARDRLNATIAAERAFLSNQRTRRVQGSTKRADRREWKPVRTKHDLRVYRRRANGHSFKEIASKEDHPDIARAVETGQPSLLCVGRVEGSLEDVLFGFHNSSQDEMLAVMRYVDERVWDCAELATIETAVDNDRKHPMHYVGLKRMLLKLPGSPVVLPRDMCFVEAVGVTTDFDGRNVGYFIQHSVDDPMCPPLNERVTGIIRGQIYFTYLFRETAQGFVDVFARGVFNSAGLMPKFVKAVASSTLLGLFHVVRCAQAKKLTLLANRHSAASLRIECEDEVAGRPKCGTCSRRPSSLDLSRPRTCRVCSLPVCSKCRSERAMFVRSTVENRVSLKKVGCCMTCVLEANSLADIRPYDPLFALFSTQERPRPVKTPKKSTDTAPVSGSQPLNGENDDSTIASSGCSNSGRTTSCSSGSFTNSGQRYDSWHLSSRTPISSVGLSEPASGNGVGFGSVRESSVMMSDFESESELEEDVVGDEAIDIEVFNGGSTPLVNEALRHTVFGMRHKAEVSSAYEAFTQRFTLDETTGRPTLPPVMGPSNPMNLLEKMMALHTSVQEAYSMTQANQELMDTMMPST